MQGIPKREPSSSTNIATPSEIVISTSFQLEIGDITGAIHFCFPYSTLEPIRDVLYSSTQGDSIEVDRRWVNLLTREIQAAEITLVAELARTLFVHQTNVPQSPTQYGRNRAHVFLVADGVGGHQAGEVASALSVVSIDGFLLNTLKRFFKEKDKIRLQPANPAYPDQIYDDVRIQGKLIGVIRRVD